MSRCLEYTAQSRSWTTRHPGSLAPSGPLRVRHGQVWTFDQLQGILYVIVPVRMTIVKLENTPGGGLLVYAPVAPTGECLSMVRALEAQHGPVRHIVLGTLGLEHKVFAGPFAQRFPESRVWYTPGQYRCEEQRDSVGRVIGKLSSWLAIVAPCLWQLLCVRSPEALVFPFPPERGWYRHFRPFLRAIFERDVEEDRPGIEGGMMPGIGAGSGISSDYSVGNRCPKAGSRARHSGSRPRCFLRKGGRSSRQVQSRKQATAVSGKR